MKFLDFENMLNMRDCGGFETNDGYVIKYDTLIRSDAIKELSNNELQYLLDRNITTQIDLRTESVISNYPSMLKDNVPMFAFPFKGYWKDVGTIDSFWEANMDLLDKENDRD